MSPSSGRKEPITGSITAEGRIGQSSASRCLFSGSKGRRAAFYKQHSLTLPYSSPRLLSLYMQGQLYRAMKKTALKSHLPLPFMRQIYPRVDTRLKTIHHGVISSGVISSSRDPGTGACSRAAADGPLLASCSLSSGCTNGLAELCHRARNDGGGQMGAVSERSPGKDIHQGAVPAAGCNPNPPRSTR